MPLRDDLLSPIPGDNPGGVDLRYDPLTDKVREARREDDTAPQGEWKSALKVADYAQAIKLAGEAIAKRSKDLQLAVWLVDAHVRQEGFAILPPALAFLRGLVAEFWGTLYPQIEDGDAEARAAPLEWFGSKFEGVLRTLPITSNGLSWVSYKESRTVGYENDAKTNEKRSLRQQLIDEEGKISAEDFDAAVDATSKAFCEGLFANLTASLEALETLNDLCNEKFGESSPSFVRLRTALEDVSQAVRLFINRKGGPTVAARPPESPAQAAEAVPAPAPMPVPTAAAAAAPVAVRTAPPAPAPAGGVEPVDLEDGGRRLAAIARYLRQKDVYDIAPFLILRGYRWGEIRYNGPQIDAAMLEAPPAELRTRLKQAWAAQDWDAVLEATEAAMELPCGRGWLDAQRYAVKALENKGQWFEFVTTAVRTELRGLLQDLPGLLDANLADDTPAANPETRVWIENEVLAGQAVRAVPQASPAEEEPAPEAEPTRVSLDGSPPMLEPAKEDRSAEPDAFALALDAAGQGRHAEALQTISHHLATARSGRARFRRRAQLAHVLMATSRGEIAQPILEDLAAEIESRRLEEWEDPEALAYPLSLLLSCLQSSDSDPDLRRQIYARICRLDPVRALECSIV
jgi:type VI secretion system protein ImpA